MPWTHCLEAVPVSQCALPLFQSGGAVVTTLSQTGSLFKPSSAHLPHELLGKVSSRGLFSPLCWETEPLFGAALSPRAAVYALLILGLKRTFIPFGIPGGV